MGVLFLDEEAFDSVFYGVTVLFTALSRAALSSCTLLAIVIAPTSPALAHDPSQPQEHFSVDMPAKLSPSEADAIYADILDDMIKAYSLSRDPDAANYRRWQRHNSSAYPSGPHGTRYVNVYGNGFARPYGEAGQIMPEGAVLAKDSFAVADDGDAFVGPLFVMEKMTPGFDADSGDWRYSMIMPDGSFFGRTGGDNAHKVEFCVTCHEEAGAENDYLFFVPEAFRTGE